MLEGISFENFKFAEDHISDALTASKTQMLASVDAYDVEAPSLALRAQAELNRLKLPQFRHAVQVVCAADALANRMNELNRISGKLVAQLGISVMAFDSAMTGLQIEALQKGFDVFKLPRSTDPLKRLRNIIDTSDAFPTEIDAMREAAVIFGVAMMTAYLDTSVAHDARLEDLHFYLKDVDEIKSSAKEDHGGGLIREVIKEIAKEITGEMAKEAAREIAKEIANETAFEATRQVVSRVVPAIVLSSLPGVNVIFGAINAGIGVHAARRTARERRELIAAIRLAKEERNTADAMWELETAWREEDERLEAVVKELSYLSDWLICDARNRLSRFTAN